MNNARILIVTQRNRGDGFARQPGYVSFTEAEDVLAASVGGDVVELNTDPSQLPLRVRRLVGRTARRVTGSTRPLPSPGGRAPSFLGARYDLAVFVGQTVWDLALFEQAGHLRRLADRVITWFPEMWASELDDPRVRYEPFDLADDIFVGMKRAAGRLQQILGRSVHHVPPAADVTQFASFNSANRPVDVLGIGRRDQDLHRVLVDWSRKYDKLYVYDTISGTQVRDPRAHRGNLGDTYRRTNIAITNYAKYDMPDLIGDERETPSRVWEGLAAGCLMAGYPPDEALQQELLGETVVLPLPTDRSAAVDYLDELSRGDHDARRRHLTGLALRHHDWAHRWQRIFELSGTAVPPGLEQRREQLERLADSHEPGRSTRPADR